MILRKRKKKIGMVVSVMETDDGKNVIKYLLFATKLLIFVSIKIA